MQTSRKLSEALKLCITHFHFTKQRPATCTQLPELVGPNNFHSPEEKWTYMYNILFWDMFSTYLHSGIVIITSVQCILFNINVYMWVFMAMSISMLVDTTHVWRCRIASTKLQYCSVCVHFASPQEWHQLHYLLLSEMLGRTITYFFFTLKLVKDIMTHMIGPDGAIHIINSQPHSLVGELSVYLLMNHFYILLIRVILPSFPEYNHTIFCS